MTGKYIIRRLPENSIVEYSTPTKSGKSIPLFKINSGTFSDISEEMQIRPKSALFSKWGYRPCVYVLLYDDTKSIRCLFFFQLKFKTPRTHPWNKGISGLDICRCVGKSSLKRHWARVFTCIRENYERIVGFKSPNDSLEIILSD